MRTSARVCLNHFGSKQVECIHFWPYYFQATKFLKGWQYCSLYRFNLLVLLEVSASLRPGYCPVDKALKCRQAVLQGVGFYCSQILFME